MATKSKFKSISVPSEEDLGRPRAEVTPAKHVIALLEEPGWHIVFWYRDQLAHAHDDDLATAIEAALAKSAEALKAAPSKYIAGMIASVDDAGELMPPSTETVRAFVMQMSAIGFVWFYDTGRWYAVQSYKKETA